MGGPNSGRYPKGQVSEKTIKRRVKARYFEKLKADHEPIKDDTRDPYAFVVEGLQRKDVSELVQIVREVRNQYANSKKGPRRGS